MQIRVDLVAETARAQAQYQALTKRVEAFNASLAQTAAMSAAATGTLNASAYAGQRAFANAIASTGNMRAETVRYNDVLDETTKKLKKQELGFREAFGKKTQARMNTVYRQQLALRSAFATFDAAPSATVGNKRQQVIGIPKEFNRDLDNANNRLGFFSERLRSASNELVKWGKNTQWAGRQLMAGITYPMVALGAVTGVVAYQIDKELTRIAKVYDTNADRYSSSVAEQMKAEEELKQLREDSMETAIYSAKNYGRAAKETLSVMAELAATGQQGDALQENTRQVMRISTLGEMDAETSTKTLISLQSVLKTSVGQTADAFNYLNAIENETSLQTQDFAEAIPIALNNMKAMAKEGTPAIDVLKNMSLLLVAMKERGIEANEGANAIKSMMNRLYRPSKQVREEWQAMMGIDPTDIMNNSSNVIEALQEIGRVTSGLSEQDTIRAYAGLFGTYQVARMRAMVDGLGDLEDGVGQVSRAFAIGQNSTASWADTADSEMKSLRESISFQFDAALQNLLAQMQPIGEIFLKVGTVAIKAATGFLDFFNSLPGWTKTGLVFVAMLAAIAGPVIMLLGLFANLAGNLGKFGGWLGWLKTRWESLTTAEFAQNTALRQTEASFATAEGRAQLLARSIDAVTQATNASIAAMDRYNQMAMKSAQGPTAPPVGPTGANPNVAATTAAGTTAAAAAMAILRQPQRIPNAVVAGNVNSGPASNILTKKPITNSHPLPVTLTSVSQAATTVKTGNLVSAQAQAQSPGLTNAFAAPAAVNPISRAGQRNWERYNSRRNTPASITSAASSPFGNPANVERNAKAEALLARQRERSLRVAQADAQASLIRQRSDQRTADIQSRAATARMSAMQTEALAMNRSVDASRNLERIRERTANFSMAGAAATVAMGASMALMMGTSNETANNIGKMLMIGTFVVPAVAMLVKMLAVGAGTIKTWVAAQWAHAAAARASAAATASSVGRLKMAGTIMGGLAKSAALSLFTTFGGILTIITAVGAGLYLWKKRQQEIIDQQVEMQENLSGISDGIIEASDNAENAPGYPTLQMPTVGIGGFDENTYQEARDYWGSDEMKERTKHLDNVSQTEFDNRALSEYVRLIREAGFSASTARDYIAAFYAEAGGQDAFTARQNAADLAEEYGSFTGDISGLGDNFAAALQAEFDIVEGAITANDWTDATRATIEERGSIMGGFFDALLASNDSEAINQYLNMVKTTFDTQWDEMYSQMMETATTTDVAFMAGRGVFSGDTLRQYYLSGKDMNGILGAYKDQINAVAMGQETFTNSLGAGSQVLEDNLGLWENLANTPAVNKASNNVAGFNAQINGMVAELESLENSQAAADSMQSGMFSNLFGAVGGRSTEEQINAQKERILNALNEFNEINNPGAVASNFEDGMFNFKFNITGDISDAKTKVEEAVKLFDNLPTDVNVDITADDSFQMMKDGYQGVKDTMIDMLNDGFAEREEAAIEANESRWDKRIKAAEDAQDAETEAFEKNWDARKESAEDYYDSLDKAIEKQIEAEQAAEDARQRAFENEKKRIERLADMANSNIDFNIAVRTGNLDEAARIGNDAFARAEQWALEDADTNAGTASEQRIAALEKRQEELEAIKDTALEGLDKREEAEKASMERLHRANLERLRSDAEASKRATRAEWDRSKALHNQKMEFLKASTFANQAEAKKLLDSLGLSFDDFGGNLVNKGKGWANFFNTELARQVRLSGTAIASDKMWEGLGSSTMYSMMKGMGFASINDLTSFLKTGQIPETFGKNLNAIETQSKAKNGLNAALSAINPIAGGLAPFINRHEGGWINSGTGSRKGVARNVSGLGPGERLLRARDGEFMVNEHSAAKYGSELEAMNSGSFNSVANRGYGVGGYGTGPAGVMAGVLGAMFMTGVRQAMANAVTNAYARQNAANSVFGMFGSDSANSSFSGNAGKYGGRNFSAEQMRNAATIARVGKSMGMSDRDVQIGIMTAIAESGLINVNYGDRDSLGLFQQRPSQGWGTPEQVRNPEYASRKFFEGLKRLSGRNDWSPWAAAQAVQRSAFADGSNYRVWWQAAQQIFGQGLTAGAIVPMTGKGGWAKPSIAGKGWSNTHDYRNGLNSPLYAHSDGVVVDSRAVTSGGSAGNGLYGGKYRSYGETIAIRGLDGRVLRYAHLAPNARYVQKGQTVRAGQLVGLSGNTGNSTGPHTHFDIDGNYDALNYFKRHGIGLKTGGVLKTDGLANLHDEEVVVDKIRTNKLFKGIDEMDANLASGGGNSYSFTMTINDTQASPDQIANAVIKKIERRDERRAQRRTR